MKKNWKIVLILAAVLSLSYLTIAVASPPDYSVSWYVQYMIDQSQTVGGFSQFSDPRDNRGLALSPDGRYLYAGYNNGSSNVGRHGKQIRKIDTTIADYTYATVAILQGDRGKAIATDDKGRVYLAEGSDNDTKDGKGVHIYSADLSTRLYTLGALSGTKPEGVATCRENGTLVLYVTDRTDKTLTRFEITEGLGDGIDRIDKTGFAGGGGVITVADASDLRGVEVDPAGRIWMADIGGGKVFIADNNGTILDSAIVSTPIDIGFDGTNAFVSQYGTKTIAVLRQSDFGFVATLTPTWAALELAPGLSGIAVIPGNLFYVATESGQTAKEHSTYGRTDEQSGWIGGKFYTDMTHDDNCPILKAVFAGAVSTSNGSGTANFGTSSGEIANLFAVKESDLPTAGKPAGTFPFGFFSFLVGNITPGATVTITITLPSPVPIGTQYWKCQNGNWYSLPIGDDDGDNVITIQLTDGSLGDTDGLENGIIVDPGGVWVPPTVSASVSGGHGGVSPGSQTTSYDGTASVTITPDDVYHIASITDNGRPVSIANPYVISNVTADHTVVVTFAIDTYTLTYTHGPNGLITGTTLQTVNHGASGTAVTAVPAANYHFDSWSDGVTTKTRIDANVTANISVSAVFAIDAYALTVFAVNGTVAKAPDQPLYDHGTVVALTATPAPGYHFVDWYGHVNGTENPINVVMDRQKSVRANFAYYPFASFVIEEAKIDWKKKATDDKIMVKGTFVLQSDVDPDGEDVTFFIQGPKGKFFKQTILAKDLKCKRDKWEFKREKGDTGIKDMNIGFKKNEIKFEIHVDKQELGTEGDWGNPNSAFNDVKVSLQIGDEGGERPISMKVHKGDKWQYPK